MYLRSPFLRLFAHDLEHMMNRSLIRHEMMMRQELERAMNTFAALEQQTIEPARPSRTLKSKGAEHKIEAPKEGENKVDSLKAKESEELSLQQPARRDVFSPWNSGFDDFFGDISPFGYGHRSIFDRFNAIERYADEMRAEMDRRFKMAEEKQEYPELKDPENTSYFMRLETNDNGNVKVKTIKKVPGSEWETKFEEYKKNDKTAAIEKDASSENKQAIENKEQKSVSSEKKEEKPVEIKEEPYQSSKSTSPSA